MFSSTGLFKNIKCPNGDSCPLANCIFSHNVETKPESIVAAIASKKTGATDPVDEAQAGGDLKRRKLEIGGKSARVPSQETSISCKRGSYVDSLTNETAKAVPNPTSQSTLKAKIDTTKTSIIKTASKPISPPPVIGRGKSKDKKTSNPQRNKPAETLNPRMVPNDPAGHGKRLQYLKALYDGLQRLNEEVHKNSDAEIRKFYMTDAELIAYALDEEEDLARGKTSVYANLIKLQVVKIKKLPVKEWIELRKASIKPTDTEAATKKPFETGLHPEEELIILRRLVTDQTGLDQYGYVTTPPSTDDIAIAQKGVDTSGGWEECDRCQSRFQVFPDRREDGALTSGGECVHHWGRRVPVKGRGEPRYSCCQEPVGSKGCTTGSTHVFKISEAKRLALVLPFEQTPENPTVIPQSAVCFDCEMGYTCYGLELIRVTAVSWPQGDPLLDVLVRPLGQVLDFNTRFSGISSELFVNAEELNVMDWITKMSKKAPMEDEDHDPSLTQKPEQKLKIVSSPALARTLLTSLLSPDTPLIGHAIDNDLNVIRLVHPTIVDTVLLFPHFRGLPYRFGLKQLSSQYLQRNIQIAGAAGHDSLEDAKATGDLVRVKVKREWDKMRLNGWTIKDGQFFAPGGSSASGSAELPIKSPSVPVAQPKTGSRMKDKRSIAQVDGSGEIEETGSDSV